MVGVVEVGEAEVGAVPEELAEGEVFAELDAPRSERVLELMEREETGQVVLTAPKESDVRIRKDTLPRWHIRAGRVGA